MLPLPLYLRQCLSLRSVCLAVCPADGHDFFVLQVEGGKDWEICGHQIRPEPRQKQQWWHLYKSVYAEEDPLVVAEHCTVVTVRAGIFRFRCGHRVHTQPA